MTVRKREERKKFYGLTGYTFYPKDKVLEIYYAGGKEKEVITNCISVGLEPPPGELFSVNGGSSDTASTVLTFPEPYPYGIWDPGRMEFTIKK